MITQKECLDLFEYRDGKLFWKVTRNNFVPKGTEVGSLDGKGYLRTKINKKNYSVHRLIFLFHKGYLPEYLDHINGDRLDNRIENIREATMGQNNYNKKTPKTNTSGFKNVYWTKDMNKWRVRLNANGIKVCFGYYEDFEKAKRVAIEARNKLHKEFARHE
jgi:hypothetical protein